MMFVTDTHKESVRLHEKCSQSLISTQKHVAIIEAMSLKTETQFILNH